MAGARPSFARPGQEVPLYEVDAHRAESLELLNGLDALGEGGDAALPGETDQSAQDGQLVGVAVRVVDQAAVDLDEVRVELQHVRHARVPGTDVVDGEHRRRHRPPLQATPQLLVVEYRLVLGDLDDPGRKPVQNRVDAPIQHRARAEVHEQAHVVGRPAPGAGGFQAGQLELGADPELRRPLEPLVRPAAAGDRAAGEQLVAEHGAVRHPHNRLRVHPERTRRQELLHQPGEGIAFPPRG